MNRKQYEAMRKKLMDEAQSLICLLYTSDAADEL